MARRRLLTTLAAGLVAGALAVAGAPSGAAAKPKPPTKPDKVVLIVVDALSKEIVEKYDMKNVRALMASGVDTPRGYLGHTGSVTVVSHNVLTSGMLPKHMGWTNEGYRDVDGVLGAPGGLWLTSNFGSTEMSKLQKHAGYPHLSDYLDDTGKVFTVSPKGYAAYGLSGPGSEKTSVITFGSGPTCEDVSWRKPDGIAVPAYLSGACGSRFLVKRGKSYDTLQFPAQLYPATDDRYVVGDTPGHEGGDVWATDAVLKIMENERETEVPNGKAKWSGIFVSLPGVDKAAHMWGGVNDPEGATPGYDPMTHLKFAAATADSAGRTDHGRTQAERRARQHAGRAHRRPRLGRRRRRALPRRLSTGQQLRLLQLVLRRPAERRHRLRQAAEGAAAADRHRQRRLLLQRLLPQRVAEGPVAGEGQGGRGRDAEPSRTSRPYGGAPATTSTASRRSDRTG